ncbi:uncharacterized protein [Palaemon carinicauda]|uniref:uncharacterized protein n=1 Tax=Palaemon carinicauda TaxID=392227 RepID=UPI0035B5C523
MTSKMYDAIQETLGMSPFIATSQMGGGCINEGEVYEVHLGKVYLKRSSNEKLQQHLKYIYPFTSLVVHGKGPCAMTSKMYDAKREAPSMMPFVATGQMGGGCINEGEVYEVHLGRVYLKRSSNEKLQQHLKYIYPFTSLVVHGKDTLKCLLRTQTNPAMTDHRGSCQ